MPTGALTFAKRKCNPGAVLDQSTLGTQWASQRCLLSRRDSGRPECVLVVVRLTREGGAADGRPVQEAGALLEKRQRTKEGRA